MKYDVTNENVCPNSIDQAWFSKPHTSPLRQKLQDRADQVLKKRELLTTSEIEKRIQEARLRRDHASQETLIRRVEPRMQRSQAQNVRQTYLSEMARKRHQHEESKMNEYQSNV